MATPVVGTRQRSRRQEAARYPASRSRGDYDIHFEQQRRGGEEEDESYFWHDAPLFAAILPCLGAFFLGTDYIQDGILFLCVTWYLHMVIKVPWDLYTLSRPRRLSHHSRDNLHPDQHAAEAALRWRSLLYLGVALSSPFLGLKLLRTVLVTVGAADENGSYITFFHGTLFVLMAGMRPLKHTVELLLGHTRELQGVVHHPPQDTSKEIFEERIEQLELLLSDLSAKIRSAEMTKAEEVARREQSLITVQDTFDRTATRLEEGARRRERKVEVALELMERKVEGMEKKMDSLARFATDKEKERLTPYAHPNTTPLSVRDRLSWLWSVASGAEANQQNSSFAHTRSFEKARQPFQPPSSVSSGQISPRSSSILKKRKNASLDGSSLLQTVFEEGSDGDMEGNGSGDMMALAVLDMNVTGNGNGNLTPVDVSNRKRKPKKKGNILGDIDNTVNGHEQYKPAKSVRISLPPTFAYVNGRSKEKPKGLLSWALGWLFAPLLFAHWVIFGFLHRVGLV